jgi:hypothetical protein
MDSTTHNSLRLQQWKENVEKHRQLTILREGLLKDIENSPTDLPHEKRVILQRQSVEVGLRIKEFEKWIKENSIEVHVEPEKPLQKVEESKKESKPLEKNKTKTAPIKYKDKHFKEVDTLRKTLKVVDAITSVAEKYGFSIDGFRQQYYDRWLPSKAKK